MRVDEVLANIDASLEDWTVSPDAMRSGAPSTPDLGWREIGYVTDQSPFSRGPVALRSGRVLISAAPLLRLREYRCASR